MTAFSEELAELIASDHPVIAVQTHEEDRLREILQQIIAEKFPSRSLITWTLTEGVTGPGMHHPGASAFEALNFAGKVNAQTVLMYSDLHHFIEPPLSGDGPAVVRRIRDLRDNYAAAASGRTLILVAPKFELPVDLEKTVTVIDLPLPDDDQLDEVLREVIAAHQHELHIELTNGEHRQLITAARGLSRSEARYAFDRAISSDRALTPEDIAVVLNEKKQIFAGSGLLEFLSPGVRLEDVGGLDALKAWLASRSAAWSTDAEEWGIPAPKGLLLTGVPGCGKSLTAKVVAASWNVPLLRMDMGAMFNKWIGGSEENMRRALKLAESAAPAVLWIDEIEKGLGGTSGESNDGGTSMRLFSTFLTWLQDKQAPVFVMATANDIHQLPAELLRKGRFDEIFFVDLPNDEERRAIWAVHLKKRFAAGKPLGASMVVDDQLLGQLSDASEGFSGAEIEQAVTSAAYTAFESRRAMLPDDLLHAIKSTVCLSVTSAERVAAMRQWAATRAVPATTPA